MRRRKPSGVPLGYLGGKGFRRVSDEDDQSRLFVEEGPIPLGARGFRLLREGDMILYKRPEDRESPEVQCALVEVVGTPGAVLIDVRFYEAYSGTVQKIPRDTVRAATSYELYWDRQTSINPQLEETLRRVHPQEL